MSQQAGSTVQKQADPESLPETKEHSHGSFSCLLGPQESIGFPKAPAGGGAEQGPQGAGHPGKLAHSLWPA